MKIVKTLMDIGLQPILVGEESPTIKRRTQHWLGAQIPEVVLDWCQTKQRKTPSAGRRHMLIDIE
ncbi:MAG: hypothetical protein KKA22_00965 [Gammaproteobacteria bacterium]|nr:hypothetical protein [Gammaproteobacteria bacterium]MBU1406701.1 hypothetical protein [Gammaproteobacteria bacterium]MBU1533333.1 hypothetical protein [Gammaproteobacteria bacterium]